MEYFFNCYYVHTNLLPTDIYPVQYGEEQCKPSHHFGPCVRNNYLIHYVYSGKGIFRIHGQEYQLRPGQLFLIPPNCPTYYKADNESPWLYRWIEFNGSFADKFLNNLHLTLNSPILTDTGSDLGTALREIVAAGEMPFEQTMALFWNFLSTLKGDTEPAPPETSAEKYISHAELYIKNNLHKNISVNSVADYIGIDRSYLCRLFSEHKSIGPKQYIDNLKMNRAIQYLKLSSLSITEIALSLGYCDCHAFHKAFKKYYNCSPSQWRNLAEFEQTIQTKNSN